MPERHVVLRHRKAPGVHHLAAYVASGGYEQLRRAVTEIEPAGVVSIITESGLRGRGGAGFPTGQKWSFVPLEVSPRFVVVNNDESEPGAFKDRELTLFNPHQVIEGAAIAAYATGAERVIIYNRGEFWREASGLRQAVAEARAAGYLGPGLFGTPFSVEVTIAVGGGAYVCGEESALLDSLEGRRGEPRTRPPYPTSAGLYGLPTVVNNTETLANVAPILARGADWYRSIGTADSPGTKIFSVSGHVERPGNYELPLGTRFGEILELAGGVWRGRQLKAVLPAGASAPVLPADVVADLPLDWSSVAQAGSDLGSGSLVVMDDATDMVEVAELATRFFEHESCGKCTPCREGTYWLSRVYARMRQGRARADDVELLSDILRQMTGRCFCLLGEFATTVPESTIRHYRDEYERYVADGDGK